MNDNYYESLWESLRRQTEEVMRSNIAAMQREQRIEFIRKLVSEYAEELGLVSD